MNWYLGILVIISTLLYWGLMYILICNAVRSVITEEPILRLIALRVWIEKYKAEEEAEKKLKEVQKCRIID